MNALWAFAFVAVGAGLAFAWLSIATTIAANRAQQDLDRLRHARAASPPPVAREPGEIQAAEVTRVRVIYGTSRPNS